MSFREIFRKSFIFYLNKHMKNLLFYLIIISFIVIIVIFFIFDTEIVAHLSLLASVFSLIVAGIAIHLQQKSDTVLTQIENNIDRIEHIQDKVIFEMEKNRLMNATKDPVLSEINKKDIEDGTFYIFTEPRFIISIKDKDKREYHCSIVFIKENNKPYALPKMFHPFDRLHSFPYFCVSVSEVYLFKEESNPLMKQKLLSSFKIQTGKYYLTYHFNCSNKSQSGWYITKHYPISEGSKFVFSYTSYGGGAGPSADKFCNNC